MPNETEVIQADVYVDFPLPNGKTVRGKPVPYPEARKILAALAAFDQTNDERALQATIDRFTELSGISDADVLALYPEMTFGDLIGSIYRFFFHPSRLAPRKNGAALTSPSPSSGA